MNIGELSNIWDALGMSVWMMKFFQVFHISLFDYVFAMFAIGFATWLIHGFYSVFGLAVRRTVVTLGEEMDTRDFLEDAIDDYVDDVFPPVPKRKRSNALPRK